MSLEVTMSNPVATDTFDKVKAIIVEKLCIEEESKVAMETTFEELGADSLGVVELVMAFEETFGITISDEDAEGIKTVGEAVTFIERATGG
jgi:acyl carrier protein